MKPKLNMILWTKTRNWTLDTTNSHWEKHLAYCHNGALLWLFTLSSGLRIVRRNRIYWMIKLFSSSIDLLFLKFLHHPPSFFHIHLRSNKIINTFYCFDKKKTSWQIAFSLSTECNCFKIKFMAIKLMILLWVQIKIQRSITTINSIFFFHEHTLIYSFK